MVNLLEQTADATSTAMSTSVAKDTRRFARPNISLLVFFSTFQIVISTGSLSSSGYQQ